MKATQNISRRTFLKRIAYTTTGIAAASIYPAFIEPHRIQINHIHLAFPALPAAFEGLTIAHITDLHRSRAVSAEYLTRCVELINAEKPDLIALTGDYITSFNHFGPPGRLLIGNRKTVTGFAYDLGRILARARAKFGVYASLGNHDVWFDPALISNILKQAGICVLRDESATTIINGQPLAIIGLRDFGTEAVHLTHAFAGVNAPFNLVLMHNPSIFERWTRPGNHLILAGHTHGGQINLPLIGPPILPSNTLCQYPQGLFQRGNSRMYVNRGVGVIYPPVRFNCRPEIAIFHLHSA